MLLTMCLQVLGLLLSSPKFTKLIFGSCPFFRVSTVEDISGCVIASMYGWPSKSVVSSAILKSLI